MWEALKGNSDELGEILQETRGGLLQAALDAGGLKFMN